MIITAYILIGYYYFLLISTWKSYWLSNCLIADDYAEPDVFAMWLILLRAVFPLLSCFCNVADILMTYDI